MNEKKDNEKLGKFILVKERTRRKPPTIVRGFRRDKSIMKKFLSVFFVLAFILSMTSIVFAEIRVTLDGSPIAFDVPPQTINDRTMVPLRAIFEALDANIYWNDNTQTVTATRDGHVVVMRVGDPVITVAGNNVTLDVPPQIVNDRTLVPARAVAESFGVNVDWNGETQTVILTTGTTQTQPPSESVTDLTNPDNYWVELDGTRFATGMTASEFLAQGLQVRERDEEALDRSLASYGVLTGLNFAWFDGSIWRTSLQTNLRNTGRESVIARNAHVESMIVDEQTARAFDDVLLINGIRLGVSTPEDVKQMFGEPTEVTEVTTTTSLNYQPFRNNREVNRSLMLAGYRFVFNNETDLLVRVHIQYSDFAQ